MELISLDLAASEHPPYYFFTSPQGTRRFDRPSGGEAAAKEALGPLPEGMEGTGWAVSWRMHFQKCEGNPIPLPIPKSKQYFASFKEMFKMPLRMPQQQQAPFHRCPYLPTWEEKGGGGTFSKIPHFSFTVMDSI